MVVYLIRNLRTRRIKIGTTTNLQARLRNLQTGNDEKLHVEAQCPGDSTYENELHRRFADKRHSGEWFNLTETDMRTLRQEFQKRSKSKSKCDKSNDYLIAILMVFVLILHLLHLRTGSFFQ